MRRRPTEGGNPAGAPAQTCGCDNQTHRTVWLSQPRAAQGRSAAVGGGLVLLDHAGRDTPALADRQAPRLRPGADVDAALTARRGPRRAGRVPAARLAGTL